MHQAQLTATEQAADASAATAADGKYHCSTI